MLHRWDYGNYNARRYSRPWAAKIRWINGKVVYDFCGQFVGTHQGGNGKGEVLIEADPGEIVAVGQKDYRGGNTDQDWYLVTEAGAQRITRSEAITLLTTPKEVNHATNP